MAIVFILLLVFRRQCSRIRFITLVIVIAAQASSTFAQGVEFADKNPWAERPMVAVWEHVSGQLHVGGPYLRIAIWEDGRIIFAKDPQSRESESPASNKQLSNKQPGNNKTGQSQNKGAHGPTWTLEL